MITAGEKSQVDWALGTWMFLDLGFSSEAASCGFLIGDAKPSLLQFGDAKQEVVKQAQEARGIVNLVLVAPLSVCFDLKGNPAPRRCEKRRGRGRYWYIGAGPGLMVAAIYLVRSLHDAMVPAKVRLFEGFVTHKSKGSKPDALLDVLLLRETVKDAIQYERSIWVADQLRIGRTDSLWSAFRVAGMDFGVPTVIQREVE